MTYWQFHLVFTLPLFFLVVFVSRRNPRAFSKKGVWGTLTLLFLAITYTTPWDSYLIHQEIWTYEPGRVLGTLFKIPFEEYFFFIIQTIIGCLVTAFVLNFFRSPDNHKMKIGPRQGLSLLIALTFVGTTALIISPAPTWRYLYLVAVWALPVLILQWSLGLPVLLKEKKTWWLTVVVLTTYFCLADSYAIAKQIWVFPTETISGIELFNVLPIEEALFFLVTNLMVVQGYILFTTVDFENFRIERLPRSKG